MSQKRDQGLLSQKYLTVGPAIDTMM